MSKQLITANDIRQAQAEGKTQLQVVLPQCIVTPEARVVAAELGVTLLEQVLGECAVEKKSVVAAVPESKDKKGDEDAAVLQQIRQAILAKFPAGTVDSALVDQLVRKAMQERQAKGEVDSPAKAESTAVAKIKCVKGSEIKFDSFTGAGEGKQVGIADVIGCADHSSMAAGFMQWENAFFPWTLSYDEVSVVLDGELHIRHQGETHIAKAGDILFIPKGSSIEFGTPTRVRFVYVAWPANWQ